jgi:hypothetical protein
VVRFLNAGYRDSAGAAVAISGYYVTPHCDPDCCQAFGGISKIDMGRSARRVKPENGPAGTWSKMAERRCERLTMVAGVAENSSTLGDLVVILGREAPRLGRLFPEEGISRRTDSSRLTYPAFAATSCYPLTPLA